MFNITKVNSHIRKSDTLFWYRNKESDYVMNGYWAIKADLQKQEYRKMLSTLVEIFGMIPANNQEFKRVKTYRKNSITKDEGKPEWLERLERMPRQRLLDTELVDVRNMQEVRVFKGINYVYVNVRFLEMVDVKRLVVEGGNRLEPLFFNGEEEFLLVMPMRIDDANEYVKGIKKDSKGLQSQKSQ